MAGKKEIAIEVSSDMERFLDGFADASGNCDSAKDAAEYAVDRAFGHHVRLIQAHRSDDAN